MTWAGPRVYWAMARDGMISPWLARLHHRTAVPARAIVFQSLWASLLILSGTFEQLLIYSGLVLSLFMALTLSTIFRLRRARIVDPRQYRAPLYPFLPAAIGHLQFRPTAGRIVVRRGDRLEWDSTLLFLAQIPQSSPGQILTRLVKTGWAHSPTPARTACLSRVRRHQAKCRVVLVSYGEVSRDAITTLEKTFTPENSTGDPALGGRSPACGA